MPMRRFRSMLRNCARGTRKRGTGNGERGTASLGRPRSPSPVRRSWFAASRKPGHLLDALGLEQVAVVVPSDDLKAGTDRESDQRHKRVSESYPVDIASLSASCHFAHLDIARDEAVENGRINLLCDWDDLARRAMRSLLRCRFDVSSNEPATEPARGDLHRVSTRGTIQRLGDGSDVHFVGQA